MELITIQTVHMLKNNLLKHCIIVRTWYYRGLLGSTLNIVSDLDQNRHFYVKMD